MLTQLQKIRIPNSILPVLAGISIGLGWHPYNVWPLVFVGFAILMYFIQTLQPKKWVFIPIYFGMLVWNIIDTSWLIHASWEGAILAISVNSLLMTLVWWTGIRIGNSAISRQLISIGLYLLFEFFHLTHWDLSWPWLTIGYSLADQQWMIQWYSFLGPIMGSAWVLIVSLGICKIKNLKTSIFVLGLWAIPVIFSSILLVIELGKTNSNKLAIGVIQPNIDPYINRYPDQTDFIPYREQFGRMLLLTQEVVATGAKLVLWPETSLPKSVNESVPETHEFLPALKQYAKENSVEFIVGNSSYALLPSPKRFSRKQGEFYYDAYNSAIHVNETTYQFQHKSRLVPGVEKVPFSTIMQSLQDATFDFGGTTGTLAHSDSIQNWNVDSIQFAPLICYESVYPHFIRKFILKGASCITIITNDGWWSNSAGHKQHLAIAQVQAISFRRSITRSAYTGVSAYINPLGYIEKSLTYKSQGSFVAQAELRSEYSFFTIVGDISPFFALLCIGIGGYFRKSKKHATNS